MRSLLLIMTGAAACVLPGPAQPQAVQFRAPIKIILVGDSTTAVQTGWGGAFCGQHVTQYVSCVDMGRGGRSTKTYRNEGHWALALNEAGTNGYAARYVLIEMGHNDKSTNPAIGTDLQAEFPANLVQMIREVRDRGAIPVLVTPLARRYFANGKLSDSLTPWADAVRQVASQTNSPVIDLNSKSAQLFAQMGPVKSLEFENRAPTAAERAAAAKGTTLPARVGDSKAGNQADYIHLNEAGAGQVSSLVAKLLGERVPALQSYVFP
ncbi:rhamnogalacturonan acetylesterase [Novosphingobium sp.]|uniref:rhamnogalacturonan acetylesterase n=1 Tax=Novosphingobium sp. TaxID=1874826 RepID=UPI003BACB991